MRIAVSYSLLLFCLGLGACAPQPPPNAPRDAGVAASEDASKKPNEPVDPHSPRATVLRFLDLTGREHYASAAHLLDLEGLPPEVGPERARRLRIIIDREVILDPELLSSKPEGDTADGLPATAEDIATVKIWSWSRPDKIKLVRRDTPNGPRWLFSKGTVEKVDEWYNELPDRWILEHLPRSLLQPGWRGFAWWQCIAFPIWFAIALGVGFLLARLSRFTLFRLITRQWPDLGESILKRTTGPLTMAWALLGMYFTMPWLGLYERAEIVPERILRSGFFLAFFWSLFRSIDVFGQAVLASPFGRDHVSLRTLIPLGGRVGKVTVVALTIVAVLSGLGYPVATLVAGLGIGGLAFALAAQKTVENLFGAFSISVDQPFRLGDTVKVDDVVGYVESLGLRSTRIRTFDRTLVTMPNGKLADSRVESFSARDRSKLRCTVSLPRATTSQKAREVLAKLEEVLRSEPKIWKDGFAVQPKALTMERIDLDVTAWFAVSDLREFQEIRKDVLFKLIEVMEQAGGGLIAES